MDQDECVSSPLDCPFYTVPDDVLIIIFSFLTLYERLMVMRVSKRCYRILCDTRSWSCLNFWQKQKIQITKSQVRRYRTKKQIQAQTSLSDRYRTTIETTWMFPKSENLVLDFLNRYTGKSLKSIRLHVISQKILTHLKQYEHLEKMSFVHYDSFWVATLPVDLEIRHHYPSNPPPLVHPPIPRSTRLGICELYLENVQITSDPDNLWSRLEDCKNLRRLALHRLQAKYLTYEACEAIANCPQISDLNFFNLVIDKDRGIDNITELDAAMLALLKLTKVNTFRFSSNVKGHMQSFFEIDSLLCGIAEKWPHLTCLSLSGIQTPSNETFVQLFSALTQLEILQLSATTDETIALIARYLQKLKCLTVKDGLYTANGIRVLCYHPFLQRLHLLHHFRQPRTPKWLMAVYNVILSLPKITFVKLAGRILPSVCRRVNLPLLPKHVKLEIKNASDIYR